MTIPYPDKAAAANGEVAINVVIVTPVAITFKIFFTDLILFILIIFCSNFLISSFVYLQNEWKYSSGFLRFNYNEEHSCNIFKQELNISKSFLNMESSSPSLFNAKTQTSTSDIAYEIDL